jgi:hypothetical protein
MEEGSQQANAGDKCTFNSTRQRRHGVTLGVSLQQECDPAHALARANAMLLLHIARDSAHRSVNLPGKRSGVQVAVCSKVVLVEEVEAQDRQGVALRDVRQVEGVKLPAASCCGQRFLHLQGISVVLTWLRCTVCGSWMWRNPVAERALLHPSRSAAQLLVNVLLHIPVACGNRSISLGQGCNAAG